MPSRVDRPDDSTLPISDGDWLLVKKRLNAGENKRMIKRGSVQTADGWRMDSIEAGTAKVLAYLIDWSLKGLDGKVIPIRGQADQAVEAALDAISPDTYTEILRAIEAHEIAMDAERAAEKNGRDGEKGSPAISPSPSAAAGASSGSVN